MHTIELTAYARCIESMKILAANNSIDLNRFSFQFIFLSSLNPKIVDESYNRLYIMKFYSFEFCDFIFERDPFAVIDLSKIYQTITENYDKRNYIIGLYITYTLIHMPVLMQ